MRQPTLLLHMSTTTTAVYASSFASLNKRDKRKRNYDQGTRDVATKAPGSLGRGSKQSQQETSPPSHKRLLVESRHNSNKSSSKYDNKSSVKYDKRSFRNKGYASSFASLNKREQRKRKQHHRDLSDVATQSSPSLARGCKRPLSGSSTLCLAQDDDPKCFKCFVASRNLFVALQQYSGISGHEYKCNKTFRRENYASFY